MALALMWAGLARDQTFVRYLPNGSMARLGFTRRVDRTFQDALLADRAMHALTALIDRGVRDPALHEARSDLLVGWNEFTLAAQDLQTAATLVTDDAAGRVRRFELQERERTVKGLRWPHLWFWKRWSLQNLAERIGRHPSRLIGPAPEFLFSARDDLVAAMDPVAHAYAEQATARGMAFVTWTEIAESVKKYGARALGASWSEPDGAALLEVEAVRERPIVSMISMLDDGFMLQTMDREWRYLPQTGPWFDRLIVDVGGSLAHLASVHRLRLQLALLDRPGTAVRALRTTDDVAAVGLAQWQAKRAFRAEVGKSMTEARAIPIGRPEFIPMVLQTTRAHVAKAVADAANAAPAA